MNSIVYVGMDVHKEQYTICCYSYETDKVEYKQTIPSDYKLVLKYIEQVRSRYDGEVTFVCGYEAGCLGYSLYHQLKEHAVDCKILAPSTMAVTNTHHVKTDKRDAANIARCLAFHTYSEVYVPDNVDNDVKEYIRMRDDQKLNLKKVKHMSCLLGIKTHTALSMIVEVGDFERFEKASKFASFLGLVPSEDSSDTRVNRYSITKAGNSHLRRLLVEAAQSYTRGNVGHKSVALKQRQKGNPPEVIAYADKANERLRRRFYKMTLNKGVNRNVAATAIARELACFIWGMMTEHVS